MRLFASLVTSLGRPVVWLGALALLLMAVGLPLGIRYIYWALEDPRVLEEIAEPVVVDYPMESTTPIPRTSWEAGQTIYVVRRICTFRPVAGHIERSLQSAATIPLEDIPLVSVMPPAETRAASAPPWCNEWISSATLPPYLTVGPIVYQATVDAYLNPAQPHVAIPLRPARLTIASNPLQNAMREHEAEMLRLRREFESQLRQFAGRQRAVIRQLEEARQLIQQQKAYQGQLDAYLRERGVLPKR